MQPKPYSLVPIRECGEDLLPVPHDIFIFTEPHPYVALGAPYGAASPWMLRRGVLDALIKAQAALQQARPGWRFLLFDAYRPVAVQLFMVEREFALLAEARNLDPVYLSEAQRDELWAQVYRLFAMPSEDPAMPPPHSTGAAIDLTLCDENGREVDMGSPIDENSSRSYPDHFAAAADAAGQAAHANRRLLDAAMAAQGFARNPGEWWHFSRGDQLAVWVARPHDPAAFAIYGRAV